MLDVSQRLPGLADRQEPLRLAPLAEHYLTISSRELPKAAPDRWTVKNLMRRLRPLREDPWREFWSARQRLG